MLNIKGVVLAGGESSRMGRDKAQLKRDHRDMFSYTVEQLSNMELNGIVLSRSSNQLKNSAQTTKTGNVTQIVRLSPLPVIEDVIEDNRPKLGPLGGIYSVAQLVKSAAILIVPIDMPMLSTDDLTRLALVGSQFHKPVYFENHYLPLYLPLNEQTRTYLEQVVSGKIKNRSVRGLCNHFGGIPLQAPNSERLHNTNTPQQWQAVQEILFKNDHTAEAPAEWTHGIKKSQTEFNFSFILGNPSWPIQKPKFLFPLILQC